jgi:signal transduction histidine kinase
VPDDADRLLAAQMRSLAAITPGVAHDLRGPINTMVFTLELLRESAGRVADPLLRERQLGYVRVLSDEVRRLHRQLEIFLTHTVSPPGTREVVDLKALAAELADLLAGPLRKRRVELRREMSDARLAVAVDRSALRHALLLLVLAALAAVPEGGSLTLSVAAQGEQAEVEVMPAAGATASGELDAARALLSPFGGTLVTVTDGPASTPKGQRVQLPLVQGG